MMSTYHMEANTWTFAQAGKTSSWNKQHKGNLLAILFT